MIQIPAMASTQARAVKPRDIYFSPTYACNSRCRFCYAPKLENPEKTHARKEDALHVVEFASGMKARVLKLIGGEPTVYPHLTDILERGEELGQQIHLISNGRKLSNERFFDRLIESGLNSLSVSVHGSKKEIHEGLTGVKSSFRQSMKAIDLALDYGIHVSTITTINKKTLKDLPNVVEMFAGKGIHQINLILTTPHPGGKNWDVLVQPEEIPTLVRIADECARLGIDAGASVRLRMPFPYCWYSQSDLELIEYRLNNAWGFRCGATRVHMDIAPDLTVTDCSHNSEEVRLFDLRETTPEEIAEFMAEHEKVREVREDYMKPKHRMCASCPLYPNVCTGGCPLLYYFYTPDLIPKLTRGRVLYTGELRHRARARIGTGTRFP